MQPLNLLDPIRNKVMLWVGIPNVTGRLPLEAEKANYPIMVSSSRFWVTNTRGVSYFKKPSDRIKRMRVFLDSAGYTAMRNWKGFPWTTDQYLDLIESGNWEKWSQMDLCCERDIAGSRSIVRRRVEKTADYLHELRIKAGKRGLSMPLPVLQGWHPDDYEYSVQLTDQVLGGVWPDLVGVGSICNRKKLYSDDGVVNIIARLNRVLPDNVGLHLFGVKGDALPKLSMCQRVRSCDSMAWDYAARSVLQGKRKLLAAKEGITIKEANKRLPSRLNDRIPMMHEWVKNQRGRI